MRPNILVCAAPKSGSSHIKLSLQKLLGYRSAYAVSDNVLYSSAAQIVFHYDEQILHHHIEATPCNSAILKRYEDEVKVILTLRNVMDSVVSLVDYLDWATTVPPSQLNPTSDWATLEWDQKVRWAVYNSVPWYFKFYVAWRASDVKHLEVWYEDFFKEQVTGIRTILDYVGIDQTNIRDVDIEDVTRRKDGKFNVGRSGRGKEKIPWDLQCVIHDSAESWGSYWGNQIKEKLLGES
jgi:hypothetical protein